MRRQQQERDIIKRMVREDHAKHAARQRRHGKWIVVILISFVLSLVVAALLWSVFQSQLLISKHRTAHDAGLSSPVHSRHVLHLLAALSAFMSNKTVVTVQSLVKSVVVVGDDLVSLLPTALGDVAAQGVGSPQMDALLRATDVLYLLLLSLLEGSNSVDDALGSAVRDMPATVYQWTLSTVYVLNQVITEYCLRTTAATEKDEQALSERHATSLLKANQLIQSVSEALVERGVLGGGNANPSSICDLLLLMPSGAKKFCRSTFDSSLTLAQRVAANYEELIAIYPRYGPFRLHYVVSFVALQQYPQLGVGVEKCAEIIKNDRKRLHTYQYKDELHQPFLDWLETFVLADAASISRTTAEGEEDVKSSTKELDRVLRVLQVFPSCNSIRRPFTSNTWPALPLTERVVRPPLLKTTDVKFALDKLSGVIPADVRHLYTQCS